MHIIRTASAEWKGSIKEGKGNLSTESGALKDVAYAFNSRFENEKGSNPEELIAAAHAGCFSMQLSANLGKAGFEASLIKTKASVHFKDKEISEIKLETEVEAKGLDMDQLKDVAHDAKKNCPVSKLLNTTISLDIKLL